MLRSVKFLVAVKKVFAISAILTLMSFLVSGYATPTVNDDSLVYCPLTKTYQPRSSPVTPSSALGDICVTDRSKERFIADLLRSQKLIEIANSSELAKAFFQYARDGNAAFDRIERSRNERNDTPDQLRSNGNDSIAPRVEKQAIALVSITSSEVAAPDIFELDNSKKLYPQKPHRFSDARYANLRPRSPPFFS